MMIVESNETWLGQVPAGWSRNRIRNVATLSPGYSGTPPTVDEFCTIVPMELLSDDGVIDVSNQVPAEEVQSGLTLFEQGDVLFAKITPCMENGKGAFVGKLPTRYAFGSTEFHVLRPSQEVDGQFLYYATFNPVFRTYAAENMTGAAGQKRVSSRFLKDTRLFLPALPEQQRIAAYLDASCAAIDAAVAAKRRQLEILDALRKSIIQKAVTKGLNLGAVMRDSGSDGLGEIPSHWRTDRMKDVVALRNEKTDVASEEADYLELEDIESGTGRILNRRNTLEVESAVTLFKTGDILFGKLRPYLEKYVHAGFDGKCTGEILAFKPIRLKSRFLFYCIASPWFIGRCNALAYGAKMPRVNWQTQLAAFNLPLPPAEEQEAICGFLDTKLGELGRIVGSIENQIATLTAYRKSLIHECVTGQRRVTDEDVRRAGHRERSQPTERRA